MYIRIGLLGAMLGLSTTAVATPAVEAIHYQIGATADRDNDTGRYAGADTTRYTIDGSVTFPVGQYVGAAVSGGLAQTQFKFLGDSCDTDSQRYGASVFVRAAIGRVGLTYDRLNGGSCGLAFIPDSNEYAGFAEYYWEFITARLERSRTKIDDRALSNVPDFDVAVARIIAYPTANLSLGVAAFGLDAEDTYAFSIQYQPTFFGNVASLLLGYATNPDYHSISVGISYFFDRRIDLKTRDRRYR